MSALSFLLYLFMNSTIYLYQYGFVNICFILCIKIQCYFILLVKLFELWPLGALSVGLGAP